MTEGLRTSTVLVDKPLIDIAVSYRAFRCVNITAQVLLNGIAVYLLVTLLLGVFPPILVNTVVSWIVLSITVAHLLRHFLPMIVKQPGLHTCVRVYQEEVRLASRAYGVLPSKYILVKVMAVMDTFLLPFCIWFVIFPSSESPIFVQVVSSLLHLAHFTSSSILSRAVFYSSLWICWMIFLVARVRYISTLMMYRGNPFLFETERVTYIISLVVSCIVGFTELFMWTSLLSPLPCDRIGVQTTSALYTPSLEMVHASLSTSLSTFSLVDSLESQELISGNITVHHVGALSASMELLSSSASNETVNWCLRFDRGTECLSPSHKASIVFSIIFWLVLLSFSDVVLGSLKKLQESCNAAALPYQEKMDALFLTGMRMFRIWLVVLCTCAMPLLVTKSYEETSSHGGSSSMENATPTTSPSLVTTVRYGSFSRLGLVLLIIIPSVWIWLCMRPNGFLGKQLIAATDMVIHTWYQRVFLKIPVLCVVGLVINILIFFVPVAEFFGQLVWWGIWLGWSCLDIFMILFR